MDIAASSNADQNWRRWPCRYYRRSGEKAYHPSLGTRRVNRWDLYGLTLTGSQAESRASGPDYKPTQKYFVNIFSTQPRARFNSRWARPAVDLPWRLHARPVGITGSSRALFFRAQTRCSDEWQHVSSTPQKFAIRSFAELKGEIGRLATEGIRPGLAAVLVGEILLPTPMSKTRLPHAT